MNNQRDNKGRFVKNHEGLALEKNPSWKGGRIFDKSTGYIKISVGKKKYKYEHRLIMEKFLGRSLLPSESVYHINGVKTDNRFDNLVLDFKKRPVKFICKQCGKDFEASKSRNRLFCSKKCYVESTIGDTSRGFQKGHKTNVGRIVSEETRQKIGKAHKGYKPTKETLAKISEAQKGRLAWNRGLTNADPRVAKYSEAKKNGRVKNCVVCNKEFYVSKNLERVKFCSPDCYWKDRVGKYTGENSGAWRGGISFEPYSLDWKCSLKKAIRERDNYICKVCGKEQVTIVHHINYDKKNCNPDNLITLCSPCHSRTNSNREYWKNYFKVVNKTNN